jgi:6-phosphogluconolactonase
VSSPQVHVEVEALEAAARAVVTALNMTLATRASARLAVAGGSAVPVLKRVRELAPAQWPRVCLTWVDERRVAHADAASNIGAAARAGVLDAPAARCTLPLILDDELASPERACTRIAAAVAKDFDGALDVTLLGLGEDGHIASLFPGMAWDAGDAPVFLIDNAPKPPPARITLSRAFIASASTHVVYAVGAGKRDAITRTRAGDAALPLTTLVGACGGNVHVFTDAAGGGT